MRYRVGFIAFALAFASAAAPAWSAPLYTVSFGDVNSVSSASELRRDTTFDLYTSNGVGDFTGAGYAGPGRVSALEHLNAEWGGVFSGGNTYKCYAQAQATDFLITGPGSNVTGTLHFWASADLSLGGGFVGNNAHETQFSVRADVIGYGNIYGTVLGSSLIGNFGPQSSGCLAGQTSSHVDVPFSLTAGFPVGAPLTLIISVQADGATYGNINVSPGFVETDAGGTGDDHTGRGVRLDGSSGVVMTLPAGYTFNVPSWGVVNNTYPNLVAVGDDAPGGDMRLELAGANPSSGEARLTLALPRDGLVRVVLYDLAGRAVTTLMDGWQAAGTHGFAWDGRTEAGVAAPAGLYFIRAESEGQSVTRGLVRIR